MALAVLSGSTVGEMRAAIAAGDVKRFQVVPGIGRKTAERVIVELRERIAGELAAEPRAAAGDAGRSRRSRARASSASATTRPRRSAMLDAAGAERRRRRRARGPDRGRAAHGGEGGMTAPRRRGQRPGSGRAAGRGGARPLAAPAARSTTSSARSRSSASSALFIEAARRRGEPLDHVLLAGPPGPRQDLAGAHRRARARRAAGADGGPGARAQGRHRRVPDRARARLGVLHRRDPPAHPRGGGDALPGDGGPPAADRARARAPGRAP